MPRTKREAEIDNPLNHLLGYRLRRASTASMAVLGSWLGDAGLKIGEASVLLLINANPGITQSDIGRELGIHRANMAPMIAMLDRQGLVEREQVDGRSQGLRTSESGRELAERARRIMELHDAEMLAGAPEETRELLRAALGSIWSGGR